MYNTLYLGHFSVIGVGPRIFLNPQICNFAFDVYFDLTGFNIPRGLAAILGEINASIVGFQTRIQNMISSPLKAKYVLAAAAVGLTCWLLGFGLYYLDKTLSGILEIIVIPMIIGSTFSVITKLRRYLVVMTMCLLSFFSYFLLILLRVTVTFISDVNIMEYVANNIKAFMYLLPLQLLFSMIGCLITFKIAPYILKTQGHGD